MRLKKRNALYLLGGIVLIAAALLISVPLGFEAETVSAATTQVYFLTTNGTVAVTAEVASTPESLRRGLMSRESLGEMEGMLFVFGEEENRSFWMKNTLIPLDMLFISDALHIVHIQKEAVPCQEDPCPLYDSHFPARYVVEVKGGFADQHGIAAGDAVAFELDNS